VGAAQRFMKTRGEALTATAGPKRRGLRREGGNK